MKNKSTLALIETVIMILVFTLAAGLCLQAFAGAESTSRRSRELSRAVTAAQNAAETVKACRGDFAAAAEMLGGTAADEAWTVEYGDEWNILPAGKSGAFRTEIRRETSAVPGLGSAAVTVTGDEGTVFELAVSWQEGVENG